MKSLNKYAAVLTTVTIQIQCVGSTTWYCASRGAEEDLRHWLSRLKTKIFLLQRTSVRYDLRLRMKTNTHESPQTNEWHKTDSEGALLGCAVPAANHMRRDAFSIARAHHQELRSNLASHRNDGDKEIANANNSQTVCLCICLVICFLYIWYRCTWLQICLCLFWTVVPGL